MKRRNFFCVIASVFGCSIFESLGDSVKTSTRKDSEVKGGSIQIFLWKGIIGERAVEIELQSGAFVESQHTVRDGWWVDGYPCPHGIGPGNSHHHLRSCQISWGGKELPLQQNIFTSVFEPALNAPEDTFLNAEIPMNVVSVFPSDSGESVIITVPCLGSAQSMLIAFTISRQGKVFRSTIAHTL